MLGNPLGRDHGAEVGVRVGGGHCVLPSRVRHAATLRQSGNTAIRENRICSTYLRPVGRPRDSRVQFQLAQNVAYVLGEAERLGDLAVSEALSKQDDSLKLASRKAAGGREGGCSRDSPAGTGPARPNPPATRAI